MNYSKLILIGVLQLTILGMIPVTGAEGDSAFVSFRYGNPEKSPDITMIQSNDDYVVFRIVTHGMWITEVLGTDAAIYHELSLLRQRNDCYLGKPNLPRVPVNLPIPQICDLNISVTEISTLTLYNYNVAPYPAVDILYDYGLFTNISNKSPSPPPPKENQSRLKNLCNPSSS